MLKLENLEENLGIAFMLHRMKTAQGTLPTSVLVFSFGFSYLLSKYPKSLESKKWRSLENYHYCRGTASFIELGFRVSFKWVEYKKRISLFRLSFQLFTTTSSTRTCWRLASWPSWPTTTTSSSAPFAAESTSLKR